jgi:tyrosyl-tRNA synthetase
MGHINKSFGMFRLMLESEVPDMETSASAFETIPPNTDISSLKGIVKFGIDPTGDKMHLGHLIPLRMVKKLKDQGCEVHIILGTFTAQMGDPSGKDVMRPVLAAEQTKANAESLLTQVKRIVGNDIIIHRNHEWFDEYTLPKVMSILSKFTVGNLLSRDAFQKRMASNNSIGMHELIVPILQGLDSVELKADIEVGGSDQMFNFHTTRQTQEVMGQKPETCVMAPIINGIDGRKMSKSYNNCIFINDAPKDVFGKAMSISDAVMYQWYPIFFDSYEKEHPMTMKKNLAQRITSEIWSEEAGLAERQAFEAQFQSKKLPENIKEVAAGNIIDFILGVKGGSKSDARRLVQSNAVGIIDEESGEVTKVGLDYQVQPGEIIKIGKRDYGRAK